MYAEPIKHQNISSVAANSQASKSPANSGNSNESGEEEVELRVKNDLASSTPARLNRRSETLTIGGHIIPQDEVEMQRHSVDSAPTAKSEPSENGSGSGDDENRPMRKYHSKSFSLSENKLSLAAAANSPNVFQQNRDLWQKRATLSSHQNLSQSRILSRNRIAPDLVMDLPLSASKDSMVTSSRESLDTELEDMTSAERFAAQNQCTLKKNERFSSGETSVVFENNKKEVKLDVKICPAEKPKAEVKPQESSINICKTPVIEVPKIIEDFPNDRNSTDEILRIDESSDGGSSDTSSSSSLTKDLAAKSPIPTRNTQKFVTQFADLKLTGGCKNEQTAAAIQSDQQQKAQALSSFKPQVKVKPQILKKPLVLPPHTPEMGRRSTQE